MYQSTSAGKFAITSNQSISCNSLTKPKGCKMFANKENHTSLKASTPRTSQINSSVSRSISGCKRAVQSLHEIQFPRAVFIHKSGSVETKLKQKLPESLSSTLWTSTESGRELRICSNSNTKSFKYNQALALRQSTLVCGGVWKQ